MMSFSVLAVRRMHRLMPGLPPVFLLDRSRPPYGDGTLPIGAGISGIGVEMLRRDPRLRGARSRARQRRPCLDRRRARGRRAVPDAGVEAIITNRPREVLAQLGR